MDDREEKGIYSWHYAKAQGRSHQLRSSAEDEQRQGGEERERDRQRDRDREKKRASN